MEVKNNITITLNENDVKEIIVNHVTKTLGYEVKENDVSFSVGSRLEGYGPMEHEVIYFNGVNITCKENRR